MSEHIAKQPVTCCVITVSDTRTAETDKSGQTIKDILQLAGHQVIDYQIVTDDRSAIQTAIHKGLEQSETEAILLNGGTGISKRDVTYEVVEAILEKELPGFGELFRYVSYEYDIGPAAMLSRAIAGTANDTALFSMPGSTGAVKIAMEKLIIPQLSHIVKEIQK
ncbi:MogA/MoaB family molybdenum cofactor biosynthesis protein [Alkalicoccobacillus gibsonii]|uniref:MogA/MoaB family molybdenum cofactor biosynthesis protein n=1 Tax=Alkalicoccobacillus gibsonii TaxID=79881 RepID=UPI0019335DE0|nr:MogA/MoaB family molybdenum cofactor biosynthesis protein [Alkalicoccobacillus gibsonii]MBM0065370.1 MogA/MoaB family molybdenum cofactor biosynthesis protein [Alkalicoccobacillus gibsonii]